MMDKDKEILIEIGNVRIKACDDLMYRLKYLNVGSSQLKKSIKIDGVLKGITLISRVH